MTDKRNFPGLLSLAMIVIVLFMTIFAALDYLSCSSYRDRAVRRAEITTVQYGLENEMIEHVYEMNEYCMENGVRETLSEFGLTRDPDGSYSAFIEEDGFRIVYYLDIGEEVELLDYHLLNIDGQQYGEVPFDD